MGREDAITREEAAAILGVGVSMISHMTRRGSLRTVAVDGKKMGGRIYYSREEVCALAECRSKGKSLPEVADTAACALAAARVTQRKVDVIFRALGLDSERLPEDRDSVLALHLEAERDVELNITGEQRVNYWADKLFSMCEEYLDRVADVAGTVEPWVLYMELGSRLASLESLDRSAYDPGLKVAYGRLHNARRSFRATVFAYILQKYGRSAAMGAFPEFRRKSHDILVHATA